MTDWKSWTPADWIRWSESPAYKATFLNPLRPYLFKEGKRPSASPDDDPSLKLDARHRGTLLTPFLNPATQNLGSDQKTDNEEEVLRRTNPTFSPTQDSHYIYQMRTKKQPALLSDAPFWTQKKSPENLESSTSRRIRNEYLVQGSSQRKSSLPPEIAAEQRDFQKVRAQTLRILDESGLPKKDVRQGENRPIRLEELLVRKNNVPASPGIPGSGQFAPPVSYTDYLATLERISGLPVVGHLEREPGPSINRSDIQIRPNLHFSEGYAPSSAPFQFLPPSSPQEASHSTSTSTSGKNVFLDWLG